MAEVIELSKLPREEAVNLAVKLLHFTPSAAEFFISLIRGEIDSDVIEVGKSKELPE